MSVYTFEEIADKVRHIAEKYAINDIPVLRKFCEDIIKQK